MREIPFSFRGSWFDLSPVTGVHETAADLHLVSHQTGMHAVLALVPWGAGGRQESEIRAEPSVLTWASSGGEIQAAFESVDTIRLRGRGAGLRIADAAPVLTPFTGTYFFQDPTDGAAIFTSYETGRRYRVTGLAGELEFDGAERLGQGRRAVTAHGAEWEIAIEEFDTARPPYRSRATFESIVKKRASDFARYREAVAGWAPEDSGATAALAAYVLWSATVEARGFLHRESILMSKHWMDKVWSWDHCFNALALAPHDIDLAIDQFLVPFDHQGASGALPDSVTHSEVLYNFVKPPIHGWALAKLRARGNREIPRDILLQIHRKLSRWSRFWLDARRAPGRQLPHYQHGNDSGWDNSTMFDLDRLVEAPDLAAFLAIQLGVLADLTVELELGDGKAWRKEQARIQKALLEQLWDGTAFHAVGVTSGQASKDSSLLVLMPMILGEQLSPEIRELMAEGVRELLTEWGPATQRLDSAEYEPDGYWRGPIWAPSTVLIEDGLRRSGMTELADEVSASFRRLCETSGFAENFDAKTGAGLRDRAYTWTASSYLLLAHDAAAREGVVA
ncbi:MAG: glycogen debranching protein [Pseudolysinimonas sp.]